MEIPDVTCCKLLYKAKKQHFQTNGSFRSFKSTVYFIQKLLILFFREKLLFKLLYRKRSVKIEALCKIAIVLL